MKRPVLLIDSNALIHRSFHALPPLEKADGQIVNAVYGYASVLIRVIQDLRPQDVIAVFDAPGKVFRHEKFPEYKATRTKAPQELYDQIPLVKDLVTAFDIPVIDRQGFEADDIIGSLAKMISREYDVPVIIVTGDMDATQLVDSKISLFTLRKGVNDTVLMTPKEVEEKFGVTPEQITDFKGLKGDASDNIPGVPGVGDKTAQTLLGHFGTIEAIYEAIDPVNDYADLPTDLQTIIKKRIFNLLKGHKDQALLSKDLAIIKTDMDVEWKPNHQYADEIDVAKVSEKLKDFEFDSLIKRLPQPKGDEEKTLEKQTGGLFAQYTGDKLPTADITKDDIIAIHPESDGWLLSNTKGENVYLADTNKLVKYLEKAQEIRGFNLKDLIHQISFKLNWLDKDWYDYGLFLYLLDPGQRQYTKKEFERFCKEKNSNVLLVDSFDLVTKTLEEKGLTSLYFDIETPLLKVLAAMEIHGVKISREQLAELSKRLHDTADSLTKEIYDISGQEFNINSPKQLSKVLFEDLGLPPKGRKNASGYFSTSADVLEGLKEHEIVGKILEYREVTKLASTYVDVLPTLADKEGRIHTTFDQTIAATGRLSSNNPNLQNIPAHSDLGREVKSAFVAPEGHSFLACDYSQIELRLAAHLSGDEALIEIFTNGEDVHTSTAARVNRVKPEEVTYEMRSFAKVINFGILYGMGVTSLAANLGIPRKEASEFLKQYKASFPGLMAFIEDQKSKARAEGVARTEFGRIRDVASLYAQNQRMQSFADRIAINMPIQGLQADIIKMAMVKIFDIIKDKEDITMILQIHDELVFEVKDASVESYKDQIINVMAEIYQASVPILVDAEVSKHL
jgi:DNA polymerase-1